MAALGNGDNSKDHSAARGSPGPKVNVEGSKDPPDVEGHNVITVPNVELVTHCATASIPVDRMVVV